MAAIHAAAFAGMHPRPWSRTEIEALLAAPGTFAAARAEGFALGRVLTPDPGGEAELLTLAVRPDARRKGAGRALLAAFEAGARTGGAAEAFLEVSEVNAPARALYAAAGWGEAGRRPRYYGDGSDALVLRKPLADPASGGTGSAFRLDPPGGPRP